MTDKRRYGVIEVERINDETFHLVINDQMWSEVEWSASRQAWCIQDAAGQCLAHVESIVGQDRDVQTAIRLAKKMIVDTDIMSWLKRKLWKQREAEIERARKLL